jgi:hypothetical protein
MRACYIYSPLPKLSFWFLPTLEFLHIRSLPDVLLGTCMHGEPKRRSVVPPTISWGWDTWMWTLCHRTLHMAVLLWVGWATPCLLPPVIAAIETTFPPSRFWHICFLSKLDLSMFLSKHIYVYLFRSQNNKQSKSTLKQIPRTKCQLMKSLFWAVSPSVQKQLYHVHQVRTLYVLKDLLLCWCAMTKSKEILTNKPL